MIEKGQTGVVVEQWMKRELRVKERQEMGERQCLRGREGAYILTLTMTGLLASYSYML